MPAASLIALSALLLAGCSSSQISSLATPAPSLTSFFNQAKPTVVTNASGSTAAPPDFECPGVDVRAGASTMTLSANNSTSDDSAMNLRYQATIGQTARECRLDGQTLTMRVGVQGRVILGPAGGPGTIDIPVRIAVVHEGPNPRTIVTRFTKVPVNVETGSGNVPFTMIEDDVSFPMPRSGVIDEYIVYVGFDPQGLREQKPPPRRGGPPRPSR